jgi:hypothetical protein
MSEIATIYSQNLSSDVRGSWRRKENYGANNLLRIAPTTERGSPL